MRNLYTFLIIAALGFLLTIILTWPFINKLSDYYKDSGDYAFDGSLLYYNQLSFKTGKIFSQQEYFSGYQFYPQPQTIAYTDHLFFPSIIFSVIYWISDQFIFSVNLLTFMTFILSFTVSFYTINYFVRNTLASIIGATVYAFNPQIFARFPYHLGLLSHFFLPLVFLYAYKFFIAPNFKTAIAFGLGFTINALSGVYFQILSLLFIPVFSLPLLISSLKETHFQALKKFIKYIPVLLIFFPILLYFNKPYIEFSNQERAVRRLEETLFFSGRFINWFMANPDNLLYGNFVKGFDQVRSPGSDSDGKFNYAEHTLSLNLLPSFLFVVGILYLWRKRKEDRRIRRIFYAFLVLLIAAFILSLGPIFYGWNGGGPYIRMPFYYLYEWIFVLKGIRVPVRLQFIFYVPFALFISYGVYHILGKFNQRSVRLILFAGILGIIILENLHVRAYDSRSLFLKPSYLENANQLTFLKDKKVLHYPVRLPKMSETSNYTLNWFPLTGSISINGYSGYISPDQVTFLQSLQKGLDEEVIKRLFVIGTNYIILHKDLPEEEQGPSSLLTKGTVYEDKKLQVVDMKEYEFDYRICDFDKDLQKNIQLLRPENYSREFYALFLKNTSNCYYPSIYKDKYKEVSFSTNFLIPTQHKAYVRLPVIIGPFEEVILSEVEGNLKID